VDQGRIAFPKSMPSGEVSGPLKQRAGIEKVHRARCSLLSRVFPIADLNLNLYVSSRPPCDQLADNVLGLKATWGK